ncbi:hypothetical protein [uncultured Lacinutrix sp.]|uniref:hypothetical protein n=1 Tax=uncultured Lacinutrix sp. TaxID=574032 RepID=UPI0026360CB4|nr:hypothetical protein [uncultured Lacinutrix sp.]
MRYSLIFTIELEHDYYSVTTPSLLRIVPTVKTRKILIGAGLIVKFFQNKLYVLVKHIDDTIPLLKLSNDFKLQFFIEIIDSNFSSITNYTSIDPYNVKLYFSNTNSIIDGNNKSIDNILFLNEKLPIFDATQAYAYNDLVRNGSDVAYECLKKVDANTGNLNDDEQFRELEEVSYVTSETAIRFTGTATTISLNNPSTTIEITYYKYNIITNDFDIELKKTTIGIIENPTEDIINKVSLNFLDELNIPFQEGIYRVTINSQEEYFYFRLENDWQPYIGLINIHNNSLATEDEYRILKEDGSFYTIAPENTEIEVRNYKIRFAPAQYLLKYVCKTNLVTDIVDDDGNIEFDNLGGNIFRSRLPVRMNEQAIDTISVTYTGSDALKKTKVPGHRELSILDDENKYIVSETFLNL